MCRIKINQVQLKETVSVHYGWLYVYVENGGMIANVYISVYLNIYMYYTILQCMYMFIIYMYTVVYLCVFVFLQQEENTCTNERVFQDRQYQVYRTVD